MQPLNSEIRNTRILYFCLCYAGVVALLGISIYLNLRKIPELALERNQSTATEINHFLLETDRLDDYILRLIKSSQPSPNELQTIFGFITQLRTRYDKPLFRSVLKSYETYVSDLGASRNFQDEELTQLTAKFNALSEEKTQLEQQLEELQRQRSPQVP